MQITPADRFINKISKLFEKPYAKGMLLLLMVVIALIWANSPFHESYEHCFHTNFRIGFEGFDINRPLHVWINDGLMALFFFTVGLEIKKELMEGELSSARKAILPVVAAIGGMVAPALIFLSFNYDNEASKAWGIPMATDIAFTLGLITLVGGLVSEKLKVFLTALATADDVGAVLVIAFFLTPAIHMQSLEAAAVYLGIMALANYLGVRNMWFYLIVGVLGLWIALFLSGIHATLAGVLGALTIPANRKITESEYRASLQKWSGEFQECCGDPMSLLSHRQEEIMSRIVIETKRASTPLQRVEAQLDPIVNYFILPLFALANTGIRIEGDVFQMLSHPVSLGIIFGLVLGKIIGIVGFTWILVKNKVSPLPEGSNWSSLTGVGMMAGIGFTMSLFIAELALEDEYLLSAAKLAILLASFISATLGLLWFNLVVRKLSAKSSMTAQAPA